MRGWSHIISRCDGMACHVREAGRITDVMEKEFDIRASVTTPDYRATYEVVYCLGFCGLTPVAMVALMSAVIWRRNIC